ncbi:MAG: hypothetical protein RLZZ528_1293 [Pseudomonadota bacterium]|jgi:protein-S-isoprenylcysteine O-methyltransferase Ste14
MLVRDQIAAAGAVLFRWRSYILLGFLPFVLIAVSHGEQIEVAFGDLPGDIVEVLAIAMVVLGEAIRILTVGFVPNGTSGRNTTRQIATQINTTGAYSVVRNPLYLGNCLMYLGVMLFTQSLMLALVMGLVLALYYERIIAAEEAFLSETFGQAYLDWAGRTPAFLPRPGAYRAPELPFSLRMAIRREHASVFAAILSLYLIEVGLHAGAGTGEPIERGWHVLILVAVVAELVILFLKKRTRVLAPRKG